MTVDAASQQAISDSAIGELVQLGVQVTDLLGSPMDVEWAWADEQVYLLQARPITSLFPVPTGMVPEPFTVLFSLATVQGLIDPITPLGQDTLKAVFAGVARLFGYRFTVENQTTLHSAAGRLFINLTGLVRHPRLRHPLRMFMGVVEPGTSQALEGLWDDPRLVPTGKLPTSAVLCLSRLVPLVLTRLIRALVRPDDERDWLFGEMEARTADFRERLAAVSSLSERLAVIRHVLDGALRFVVPHFVPRFGAGMACLNLIGQVAGRSLGQEWDMWGLTRGMPHNVTTEMDLALWQAAVTIKRDPLSAARFQEMAPAALASDYLTGRLPQAAQACLVRFLELYGMRGPGEIDLGRRRWREDPTPLIQVLQSYLLISKSEQMPDVVLRRGAAAAEAEIRQLTDELRGTRWGPVKTWLVRCAWRRMRALVGLRELPKFWAIRMMGIARQALLESGAELVAAGILCRPEDVAFLRLDELDAVADGERREWAGLVEERRRIYEREIKRVQVPRLLLSDGQAFYEGMMSDIGEKAGG